MITFTISKLGFGHFTRQIALSEAIHNIDNSIRFQFIISESQQNFFKNYLIENNIITDSSFFSPSFALSEANKVDIDSSIYSFQMAMDFDTQIRNDAEWGRVLENTEILINDIEFFHNPIAKKMKIPTINISNFTWSDLLKPLANPTLTNQIMKHERMNDLNIKLPFSTNCESFNGDYEELGLLTRLVNNIKMIELRSNLVHSQIKILLTSIPPNNTVQLRKLISILSEDYLVMIPERAIDNIAGLENKNIHIIPSDYIEFQHYINIANIVIGKAGYGLVSECLSTGTPMLFWTVSDLAESNALELGITESNMGEELKLTVTEISDQIQSYVKGNYSSMKINNKIIAKRILEFL